MKKQIKVAVILSGVVDSIQTALLELPDGSVPVIIPNDSPAEEGDLYSGGVFSANPAAADLAAAAAKIVEIKAALDALSTTAELKAKVAEIDAEINP